MQRILFWTLLSVPALLSPADSAAAGPKEEPPELRKAAVATGVQLHYVERGTGVAVVFVHGSLGDYSQWDGQLDAISEHYRAIAYSRRYNYPNENKPRPNYSAIVDAQDLAALIKKLNLGKVHVVGHSYGGYAALFLAMNYPKLVRTLTLTEPPLVFAGDRVDDAKKRLLLRVRAAFDRSDPHDAIRTIVDSARGDLRQATRAHSQAIATECLGIGRAREVE